MGMKQERMGSNNGCWGTETIIFSKPEEHQIVQNSILTTLPKLEKNWRITHDFKPTFYTRDGGETLCLMKGNDWVMSFCITATNTEIGFNSKHCSPARCLIKNMPTIGEWTTIDVMNEELEPGKCTFTVFFGGEEVFKEEKPGTRELIDVCVAATSTDNDRSVQPGFIRGLTIMTKK